MKRKTRKQIVLKSFAIFAIYLILSVTVFTARTLAALDYSISGDAGVSGFARKNNDFITINTTSDGNVSFIKGAGTSNYKEIPLTGCIINNGKVECIYNFNPADINVNTKSIPFTLKQQIGTPTTKNGVLYIDSFAPVETKFTATKNGTGIIFDYTFTDYLFASTETTCIGSGIGYIELNIQGRFVKVYENKTGQSCVATGKHFEYLSGNYGNVVAYYAKVVDRVGNEKYTVSNNISGDFKAPTILNNFKILKGTTELLEFSGAAETMVDIVVQVEDSDISSGEITGDLSDLNINPAVNIPYKNLKASCTKDSGNIYNCVFSSVMLRPADGNLVLTIFAKDSDGNVNSLAIEKFVTLKNNAGEVLFLGTTKDHCSKDLNSCYAKSGIQLFRAEIDTQSSYAKSIVNIGIDSSRTFAICKLNATWECTSVYRIPADTGSLNLFIADSADDYGNKIKSDIERVIYVDNDAPQISGTLTSINSNNNNNCSVAGDELFFKLKAIETVSPELKIYVNTTAFTTKEIQYGTCTKTSAGDWDCKLTIKDFTSIPNNVEKNIIVEDLAGNKLVLPYVFRVCKSSSENPPNVIYGLTQKSVPNIDRRTASIIPIKTFIPISLNINDGAQVMYISIDRCVAPGTNGLDVMSTGHYFIPTYGKDMMMVLNIGHTDAQLLEGAMTINCTVSARINIGDTVYTRDEKETILIDINTFNQPLGSIDENTANEITNTKNSLKDLDKSLAKYEDITSILETICDISDILVKLNSILQAVKAVLYAVCLILQAWFDIGEALWQAVNEVLSVIDSIVQKYVWPTGENGTAIGYIWKYTCIIYNCKFYTLSGLIEVASDAATAVQKHQSKTVTSEPCEPGQNPCTTTYKDGHSETVDTKKEVDQEATDKAKQEAIANDEPGAYDDDFPPVYKETGTTTTTQYPNGATTIVTTNNAGTETVTVKPYNSGGSVITTTTTSADGKTVTGTTTKYTSSDGTITKETAVKNSDGTYNVYSAKYDKNEVAIPGSETEKLGVKLEAETTAKSGGVLGLLGGGSNQPTGYDLNDPDSIPVSTSINNEYDANLFDPNTAQRQNLQSQGQQGVLYGDIDRHDWIINPYRSTYYDGLCLPATVYNIQKERQIKCMYLSCLQDSQNTGLPVSVCKDLYEVNKCLYLESAQYRLNSNIFSQIAKGLVQQAIMYAMGYATQTIYTAVCAEYIESYGAGELNANGWHSVGCGLFGAGLKYQEIAALLESPGDVMKQIFKGAGVDDPAKIYDYCDGGQLYAE